MYLPLIISDKSCSIFLTEFNSGVTEYIVDLNSESGELSLASSFITFGKFSKPSGMSSLKNSNKFGILVSIVGGKTVVGETVVGETRFVDWVESGINLVKVRTIVGETVVVETRFVDWVEDEIGSVLVSSSTLNSPFKKILD